MKKVCAIGICIVLWLTAVLLPVSAVSYTLPEDMKLSAKSAIFVSLGATPEADTVLYERDADTPRAPAAMLRMMVGCYAVKLIREQSMDTDTVTGTYTLACDNIITGTGLGTANLKIGDVWTLKDMLTVSMMETAADACVTMAVTLSGSVEAFVAGMNEMAQEIGCENTVFVNVTGLDAAGQYTTARDMMKITRRAMEYPELVEMLSQPQYKVKPVKGAEQVRANSNGMIRTITDSYYRRLSFGRTGFTDNAGRCMAAVAQDNGYEYLAVVMGCAKEDGSDYALAHYEDMRALCEWGFSNFTYKTLISKNQPVTQLSVDLAWSRDTLPLVAETDFSTIVEKNLDPSTVRVVPVLDQQGAVDAPIEKGTAYGKAELYINIDQKIGEVTLIAGESLERSDVLALWRSFRAFLASPWLYIILGLLLVMIAAYIILSILHNRRRRRYKGGPRLRR